MNDDQFDRIIRRVVEGQIRGFLMEHPAIVAAVDWYAPRTDNATTFTNSLSKRITRDLLCTETRMRLVAALGGTATAPPSDPPVECKPAAEPARLAVSLAGPFTP